MYILLVMSKQTLFLANCFLVLEQAQAYTTISLQIDGFIGKSYKYCGKSWDGDRGSEQERLPCVYSHGKSYCLWWYLTNIQPEHKSGRTKEINRKQTSVIGSHRVNPLHCSWSIQWAQSKSNNWQWRDFISLFELEIARKGF